MQNRIAIFLAQRIVHSAGHNPCRMNALSTQPFDDLLPEFAKGDTITRQAWVLLKHPEQEPHAQADNKCRLHPSAEQ